MKRRLIRLWVTACYRLHNAARTVGRALMWVGIPGSLVALGAWSTPVAAVVAVAGFALGRGTKGLQMREELAAAHEAWAVMNAAPERDDLALPPERPKPAPEVETDPEPEAWAMDGAVEPRRYPARCGCGRPAVDFDEDGPFCDVCAPSSAVDARDAARGFQVEAARLRSGPPRSLPDPWQPAKGRWLS